VSVVNKMSRAVTQDPRDRQREPLFPVLGIENQRNVLTSQRDRLLILS